MNAEDWGILSLEIEDYLFARAGWVPAQELCEVFGLRERALRQVDEMPGLCTAFAISGKSGLKHVSLATTAEWLEFKHSLRKHAVRELMRVRHLGALRSAQVRHLRSIGIAVERDSNQTLLPYIEDCGAQHRERR